MFSDLEIKSWFLQSQMEQMEQVLRFGQISKLPLQPRYCRTNRTRPNFLSENSYASTDIELDIDIDIVKIYILIFDICMSIMNYNVH